MSDFLAELSAHPNDAYFKAVFSQPEHATAFFQHHLPPALATGIDWSSLTLMPSSFVQQNLQQTHSDLLFSATAGARKVLLYLLFEHQSTVDLAIPLRVLAYMLNIWLAHEKQHGLPLPPVVPFVLHQGPDTWNVSTHFEDLLDIPPELAAALLPFLPKFSHALLDLTRFNPAKDEHQISLQVILQLMKLARVKKMDHFFRWLVTLPSESLPDSVFELSLMYALHVDSHLDVKKIYRSLEANPSLQEKAMSIAQQLIAEGKAEGEAIGELRGAARGKLQLLQQLMELPVNSAADLADVSLEDLQKRFETLQAEYEKRFKK